MTYTGDKSELIYSVAKGNRGDFVQVSRITPASTNRMVQYDLRNYYTAVDPNEGEQLRPTTKGVRVNSEQIVELVAHLVHAFTEEERIDFEAALDALDADDASDEVGNEESVEDDAE